MTGAEGSLNGPAIALIIAAIFTGLAGLVGAVKGFFADRKVSSQEATVKSQGQSIEKALAFESRITALEEKNKIVDKNAVAVQEYGVKLARFEERVLKLEQLPEKLDAIKESLSKAETERAKNDGIMNTKLDMIISQMNEMQKAKMKG